MKLKLLVLVVMLGIVGRVDADIGGGFYTANQVLTDCESEFVKTQDLCASYLGGIMDATETWFIVADLPSQICLDTGVTTGQLRRIYTKFANEHPEQLHYGAAGLAIKAFQKAFPCK